MSNISVEDITQLIQTKVREATDPLLAKIVELTDHVHELEKHLHELSMEVDDVNQQGRKEYLVLDGDALPAFTEAEDTRKVATEALKNQLDVTIPETDITACHRLQNKAKIIIKCKNRDQKDSIYSARLSQQNTRKTLYVRESLTPRRNAQVALLVEMKKEGNISNFYTRNGVIFARKNKEMKYVKIQPGTSKAKVREQVNGAQKMDQSIRQAGQDSQSYFRQTLGRQGADGPRDRQPPLPQTANAHQQRMKTRSTSVVDGSSK